MKSTLKNLRTGEMFVEFLGKLDYLSKVQVLTAVNFWNFIKYIFAHFKP